MKTCMLCGKKQQLKTIEYCIDCVIEVIEDAHKISVLINDGHPEHCACRQVIGDGQCECDLYELGYDPYGWKKRSM